MYNIIKKKIKKELRSVSKRWNEKIKRAINKNIILKGIFLIMSDIFKNKSVKSFFKIEEKEKIEEIINDEKNEKYGYVAIYCLVDPRNKNVAYVGRSQHPIQRHREHINESKNFIEKSEPLASKIFGLDMVGEPSEHFSNHKKLRWIAGLLSQGLEPELVILDEWHHCPTLQDANRLEDAWIAEMTRRKAPLFNHYYSRRQMPNWYSRNKEKYKEKNYATTPMEYIAALKSGKIKIRGKAAEEEALETEIKVTQKRRRKYAKKNYEKELKKKHIKKGK